MVFACGKLVRGLELEWGGGSVLPCDVTDVLRYRLVALDLDGTTLDPMGRVSQRTRQAIMNLVRRGVYVCFATGRNYTESLRVLEACQHFAKAVFVGGATVVEAKPTREACTLLRSVTMQPDLARELSADLESMGHAVLALQEAFTSGVDYVVTDGITLDAATSKWMELTHAKVKFQPNLGGYSHENTLRVGIVAATERTREVNRLLAEKYGSRVVTHAIAVPPQAVEVVEVFDPGVNKWAGVSFVAESVGVSGEEVIAVGDDLNDLAMLHGAGLGVAMGNGRAEAKRAAKLTIGTNAQDGLAEFLEKMMTEDRVAAA